MKQLFKVAFTDFSDVFFISDNDILNVIRWHSFLGCKIYPGFIVELVEQMKVRSQFVIES